MPSPLTVPTAGLMPTTPLSDAGQVMEPSVSVPIANGASRAASAAPEPEEEPPAQRSNRYGFTVRPPTADQPLVENGDRMLAHCERLVEPRMTRPASRSFVTNGASRGTGRPMSAVEPAVPGSPTTSTLSFTRIGTPCKGLRRVPCARSSSRRSALVSASGARAKTLRSSTSLPGASMSAMRSSNALTIATDDVAPDASAWASSVAEDSQSSLLDNGIGLSSTRPRLTGPIVIFLQTEAEVEASNDLTDVKVVGWSNWKQSHRTSWRHGCPR